MTHDPLCLLVTRCQCPAMSQCDDKCGCVCVTCGDLDGCQCEMIATVRKDERTRTLEEAIGIITDMREDHIRWYRVALQDAAEALYELRHTAPPVDTTQ